VTIEKLNELLQKYHNDLTVSIGFGEWMYLAGRREQARVDREALNKFEWRHRPSKRAIIAALTAVAPEGA